MKRRRVLKIIWSLVLVLAVLFLGGDTFGAGGAIKQIARPQLFSVASWEVDNVPSKWLHAAGAVVRGSPPREEEVARVRRYFELTEQRNAARQRLDRVIAGLDPETDRGRAEAELEAVEERRERLRQPVERIIEGMISNVLRDEELTSRFLFINTVLPPVDFRLSDVPRVLVVSSRDRIAVLETHLLSPEISDAEVEEMERQIDRGGLSSLIERIGGVATYPSMIPQNGSLKFVLETASHEWAHHYLFFHPLGRSYWSGGVMTAINETVADYVGQEIGREVYRRYFAVPGEANAVPPVQPAAPSALVRPAFSYRAEMHETRVRTDELLAAGRVAEAEAYMESRRLFMGAHGYVIRRLNQAYFAFHGNYTDRAGGGSAGPLGGEIRSLRQRSANLRDFLHRVAGYDSYDDLKRDLYELGING